MWFSLKSAKAAMVSKADALPGRADEMPVPPRHDVLGTPMKPPFPEGLETAVFGLGLSLIHI